MIKDGVQNQHVAICWPEVMVDCLLSSRARVFRPPQKGSTRNKSTQQLNHSNVPDQKVSGPAGESKFSCHSRNHSKHPG